MRKKKNEKNNKNSILNTIWHFQNDNIKHNTIEPLLLILTEAIRFAFAADNNNNNNEKVKWTEEISNNKLLTI